MTSVKIIKTNVKQVLEALSGDRLGRAVMAGAFIVEGAVKVSMAAGGKTGHMYGKHRASAEGEAPAVELGTLINSISTELVSSSDTEAEAAVGTGNEYAAWLEYGTSRMRPRPFLRPAFDQNLAKVEETVRSWAKKSIEGATK